DLHAAALADDALEAHALVLAAVALPVPGGAEDALAEQAVHLGLQGAVVDGLRLLDLAVGPAADVIGGREADAQLVEGVDVDHRCPSLDRKSWCLRERGSRAGPGGGWAARRSRGLLPVPRPSDLFDGADALVGPAGQVDAELLRGAEDLLVALLDLVGGAVAGQHLHVQAQRLHLLEQDAERLRDAGLGDVLAL